MFVSFKYDWGYGALDTFDFHDFILQDITKLFQAWSWNYGNNVKFPLDVINLLDVFEQTYSRSHIDA